MVVMDPDEVTIHEVAGDGLGEAPVCKFVRLPGLFAEGDLAWVIVN